TSVAVRSPDGVNGICVAVCEWLPAAAFPAPVPITRFDVPVPAPIAVRAAALSADASRARTSADNAALLTRNVLVSVLCSAGGNDVGHVDGAPLIPAAGAAHVGSVPLNVYTCPVVAPSVS